tara:strand:- start:2897 stop:3214 length:318 start_codon:yes stop_codon:yes gene_type:complete
MAIYIVKEGMVIRWPDHSVRASSGETFEGYDGIEPEAARVRAEQVLAQGRGAIEIASEGAAQGAKTALHPVFAAELEALGYKPTRPKKKAAKKPAKKAETETEKA